MGAVRQLESGKPERGERDEFDFQVSSFPILTLHWGQGGERLLSKIPMPGPTDNDLVVQEWDSGMCIF